MNLLDHAATIEINFGGAVQELGIPTAGARGLTPLEEAAAGCHIAAEFFLEMRGRMNGRVPKSISATNFSNWAFERTATK